jgi:hypothetical protein
MGREREKKEGEERGKKSAAAREEGETRRSNYSQLR